MIAGDHIDKNHQPSKLSSFTCNVLRVRALSFGVQTSHIRKPLNNHTRPFYLPEFLSKVQTTASSLSDRRDPGGTSLARITLPRVRCERWFLRNINPNHKGC